MATLVHELGMAGTIGFFEFFVSCLYFCCPGSGSDSSYSGYLSSGSARTLSSVTSPL